MKTIYTDRYALRLWIWALLGAWFMFHAMTPPFDWKSAAWFAGSLFWFWTALKEFVRRRAAGRRGEDPSIYKVVDDA